MYLPSRSVTTIRLLPVSEMKRRLPAASAMTLPGYQRAACAASRSRRGDERAACRAALAALASATSSADHAVECLALPFAAAGVDRHCPLASITTIVGQLFDAESVPDHLVGVVDDRVLDLVLARPSCGCSRCPSRRRTWAVWTPMTTSSFLYFFSSFARSGRTWWQLMQQYVQKSRRTILPRRSSTWIGPAVLIQPVPPSRVSRDHLGSARRIWPGRGKWAGIGSSCRPGGRGGPGGQPGRGGLGRGRSGSPHAMFLAGPSGRSSAGRRGPTGPLYAEPAWCPTRGFAGPRRSPPRGPESRAYVKMASKPGPPLRPDAGRMAPDATEVPAHGSLAGLHARSRPTPTAS